ncbi:acyl-CoA thioesterase [Desulfoluna butyratoxydans]|uniref:Hotdog domain n=1 Tax=Desulfoluna butyratoxydans TaxID=231438 RepID=A0A4V6IKX8_9BACT|nr:acyl-CoA thioesterase [Desulfoluna butyratoxydans]VFQ42898.1 hotdog domain [Desulfoluna butyratoxydans]
MQGHPVSESRVILSHLMLPQDANPAGNVHGGVIMKYIDNAAGVVATRHSRTNCVTASIDRLDFFKPMYIGELLTLKASLNMVGSTSMEIGVRVEGENLLTGEKKHVASAYLTFVALYAEDSKVKKLLPVLPETPEDSRRNEEARYRRAHRLEEKQRMLARQEKAGS